MIALLAVEWRRVLARRLVRVSAALAVLAVLAAGAMTFLVSRDMDDASLAQAQAARQVEVQRCIAGQLEGVPADIPPQERAQFCEQGFIPPVPDRRFHYEHLPEILVGTSGFAIILGWLLGASLVGAEWHAGTMASLPAIVLTVTLLVALVLPAPDAAPAHQPSVPVQEEEPNENKAH